MKPFLGGSRATQVNLSFCSRDALLQTFVMFPEFNLQARLEYHTQEVCFHHKQKALHDRLGMLTGRLSPAVLHDSEAEAYHLFANSFDGGFQILAVHLLE